MMLESYLKSTCVGRRLQGGVGLCWFRYPPQIRGTKYFQKLFETSLLGVASRTFKRITRKNLFPKSMTFPPKNPGTQEAMALLAPTLGAPNVRLAVRAKALAPSTATFTNGFRLKKFRWKPHSLRLQGLGVIMLSNKKHATKNMGKNLGLGIWLKVEIIIFH